MAIFNEVAKNSGLQAYPVLKYFEYAHLPEHLQETSKKFHELAWSLAMQDTSDPQEKAACLRKLLEAKDCAVRARL